MRFVAAALIFLGSWANAFTLSLPAMHIKGQAFENQYASGLRGSCIDAACRFKIVLQMKGFTRVASGKQVVAHILTDGSLLIEWEHFERFRKRVDEKAFLELISLTTTSPTRSLVGIYQELDRRMSETEDPKNIYLTLNPEMKQATPERPFAPWVLTTASDSELRKRITSIDNSGRF